MSEGIQDEAMQIRKQKWIEEINQITSGMDQVVRADVVTLPERIFVEVFLPIFAGDEDRLYPQASLQTWINHAGNLFTPVTIVDAKKNPLFVVPPIFDRSAVNPINEDMTSIASVVATAKHLYNLHPRQGDVYLTNELSKRATIMKVPPNVLKNLEAWNTIFKRYNRPPLMEVKPGMIGNQPEGETGGFNFDFEPL